MNGTVKITFSGYSAADVKWRINGRRLEELGVDRYQVLPDGSLLIRDVRRSDAGRYTVYISSLNLPAATPAEIINVEVQGIVQLSPALLNGMFVGLTNLYSLGVRGYFASLNHLK